MELKQKEKNGLKQNMHIKKINRVYKHKVEGLEREKQLWLQE
jgi:hypothetical protein